MKRVLFSNLNKNMNKNLFSWEFNTFVELLKGVE